MKGTLAKQIMATHLACQSCRFFRDNDPDIFYCLLQREEFPGLCDAFSSRNVEPMNQTAGCVPVVVTDAECA